MSMRARVQCIKCAVDELLLKIILLRSGWKNKLRNNFMVLINLNEYFWLIDSNIVKGILSNIHKLITQFNSVNAFLVKNYSFY